MNRTPQIAVAALALIGVPGIVGAVTTPSATMPEPTKTTLDIELAERERLAGTDARLLVITDGPPPAATARFQLTDDGGLHPATAKALTDQTCTGLTPRYATSGGMSSKWCIGLSELPNGRKVSGSLRGAGTTLTLTVARRTPFLVWPLLTTGIGLAIGALVALIPPWLRSRVRKGLLEQLLASNDDAAPPARIEGLREWVAGRQDAHVSDDALVPVVESVIAHGPPAAQRARSDLEERLARSMSLAGNRYVAAAKKIAESSHNAVGDFLNDDGTAVTPHPVRPWIAGLDALARENRALELAQGEIDQLPADQRATAQDALTRARATFAIADDPTALASVTEAREQVELAIEEARQSRRELGFLIAGAGAAPRKEAAGATEVVGFGHRLFPRGSLGKLWLLTAFLVVVVVAWAVLALEQTVYAPKPAFGTPSDYIALLTAAIGSGAAGAVISLVAVWDPTSPAAAE